MGVGGLACRGGGMGKVRDDMTSILLHESSCVKEFVNEYR